MELRAVSYEERRSRFFKDQIKSREGIMESIKSYGISDEAKHIALSEEGEKIQFFTDALNALYWIKIEYDEEGKLVAFPSEGEYALFCRKDGGIFLDEVCADDIEDGVWPVYLDSGIDIDNLVAWMPLPKPYKEKE